MNEDILSKRIEIKPLTPVYIGGASEKNWVSGVDYIYDPHNYTVYIIDQFKFIKLLDDKQLQLFSLKLSEGKAKEYIKEILTNKNVDISSISTHVFDVRYKIENDLKAFIRNGLGQPYIPGSSIKGAISSVLFHHFFNESEYNIARHYNPKLDRNTFVFGEIDNNLMHLLQISDIPFNKTKLFCSKIFNLYGRNATFHAGWKHQQYNNTTDAFNEEGLTTTFEVLDLNDKGTGYIKIDENMARLISNHHNRVPPNFNKIFHDNALQNLFLLINTYTSKHLEKEIIFFKSYQNDQTEEILEELKVLKNLADKKQPDRCILRIGGGSGFHAITGDWQFATHEIDNIKIDRGRSRGQFNGRDSAKSRKIAFALYEDENLKFFPFGFVRMKIF